jgi:GTP-binding protein Era
VTDPEHPANSGTAGSEGVTRCGFVALVGAPNAGKSTLLNTLVGEKVAIVTPKVQTTRSRILGIALEGATQMIFVDLPGIFTPRRRLERAMVAAAWQGAQDADLAVLLVDAAHRAVDEDTRAIAARLADAGRPAILALNKVDAAPHGRLLPFADELNRLAPFTDTFMISALTGDGVADLRRTVAARLPEGPWLYPEDEITDLPMRLMAAEVTREKAFLNLRAELPYSVAVETEAWEEFRDGSVRISQVIYVQRDSQKAIVLGRGGQMIRAIGAAARRELEQALERRVHLNLFVKVRDWLENPELYRPWGLDFNA